MIQLLSGQTLRPAATPAFLEYRGFDTLPIYLPGLPSLQELKEGRQHLPVILIPRLDEKPAVGIARISGVDAVLVRPLSKAKLLSVVGAFG